MAADTAVDVLGPDGHGVVAERARARPDGARNGRPVVIDPDLDFIAFLNEASGHSLKQCMQCGTCSAACTLSPDVRPFPRKEMAWAAWGMKERLVTDPDVWLCHQCNDCSVRCPRGARPGDVLARVRQEAIVQYAFPAWLGRWARQPSAIPLLLGIPTALLTAALFVRDPIERALGWTPELGDPIVYSYSRMLPRWLINGVFFAFTLLTLLLLTGGVVRLWQAMGRSCAQDGGAHVRRGFVPSVVAVLRDVLTHASFARCSESASRYWAHLAVFFGFLALSVVTLWVITAPYNPLIQGAFVYPFGFWSPWKVMANLGGVAVLAGSAVMIWDRLREREHTSLSNFADWALIGALVAVVLTGFMTEALHYVRLEPHRHLVYFVHLVFVGALVLYLPYSKLAHLVYRTTALVSAEYYGRTRGGSTAPADAEADRPAHR